MSLIQTYTLRFDTRREALDALNNGLGSRYTLHRLGEWANGKRPLPAIVRVYLLNQVLPAVLADIGKPGAIKRIMAAIQ